MAEKNERAIKVVAENRKARFNYAIEDTIEAGIALTGTEVKSIRNGKTTIAESYAATTREGELWLYNANIPEYLQASRFNHAPKRPRKLLLHRREIAKLAVAIEREGMTLVPLKLYFNEKGRAKIELPHGGKWLFAAVHMIHVDGNEKADWESFWASLTVDIPKGEDKKKP